MSLLGDASASVRLSAALCLAALAHALPPQLYGLLKFCLKVVDDHRDNGIRADRAGISPSALDLPSIYPQFTLNLPSIHPLFTLYLPSIYPLFTLCFPAGAAQDLHSIHGHAHAVSALIGCAVGSPLGLPFATTDEILETASMLVKANEAGTFGSSIITIYGRMTLDSTPFRHFWLLESRSAPVFRGRMDHAGISHAVRSNLDIS